MKYKEKCLSLFFLLCFVLMFSNSDAQQPYIITTVAGTSSGGVPGDGIPATAAIFLNLRQTKTDVAGNLYIPGYNTSSIRMVNLVDTIVRFAGTGVAGCSGDGGAAATAQMSAPESIAVDATGNIYIADFFCNCIRKINATGIISTIAGNGTGGYSGDGGPATAASLSFIRFITVDGIGNIYMSGLKTGGSGTDYVRKVNAAGIITTVAGNLPTGFSGDGGPATAAQLNTPEGLATDAANNLYIADQGNRRIRKIDAAGIITTVAGNGTLGYTGDGSAATATGMRPFSVGVDGAGNLYASDPYNNRIFKIDVAGVITAIAGMGGYGYSGDGGLASAAQMIPTYADVSQNGDIYMIHDPTHSVIRLISRNHVPSFDKGHTQSIRFCMNATAQSIDTLLAVTDSDAQQTVTWSVWQTPAHGILAAASTMPSTKRMVTPTGLTYAPTAGYSGTDSFKVIVKDNVNAADTTTVYVTIEDASVINGSKVVCQGQTVTLTDTAGGGKWSSVGVAASVGSVSGIVTGISAGTAVIGYTSLAGCTAATTVTVNPALPAISGTTGVCAASTTTLSNVTSGGTWSITGSAASVGAGSGTVTGITAGTGTITYSTGPGCSTTTVVTVYPLPAAIAGAGSVCEGAMITLSDATTGGAWSSISSAVSVGAGSGIVTGLTAGSATITYSTLKGCIATMPVTVNVTPAAIGGAGSLCAGATAQLSDATGGGTWASSNTAKATVDGTGLVAGISTGTATITYQLGSCAVNTPMTVTTNPGPITGPDRMCAGETINLSDAVTGGNWSSANTTKATVDAGGNVIGVTAGIVSIIYSLGTGCTESTSISVYLSPSPITGASGVCIGGTITLSDATSPGKWSSTDPAVNVGSTSGIVTGVAAGTATISYVLNTGGCMATKIISVNTTPTAIGGAGNVCAGAKTQLSDAIGGGTWVSSNTAKATVDGTGLVTGVAAGTVTITYSLGTTCIVTKTINIDPLPAAITGAATVCAGATIALSSTTGGGTWMSNNTGVANVNSVGGVNGVATGTATISYHIISTGCAVTKAITVSDAPTAITGNAAVCTGNTIWLTDAVAGGFWASSSGTATVGIVSGEVTGISAGTAVISYSLGGGCIVTKLITVAPVLTAITGAATVCAGATTALSNATSGGAWSATGAVSVGAGSGIVSGIAAGTGTATYTVATTGCTTTKTITVNPLPGPIMGAGSVCAGAMITLSDAGGGTWSSSASAVSVGTSTGAVTGVSPGTATVTYTLPVTGCKTTTVVQVYPVPSAIAGAGSVCVGAVVQLTDASTGGVWSSGGSVASVGGGDGKVTGMSAGTATITYTTGPGCTATTIVTVNPNPAPITGAGSACAGDGVWLYDADGGGSWSATGGGVTILSTGYATTTTAGTSTIDYTFTTGCSVSKTLTIYAKPDPITGVAGVCSGDTATVHDATTGGIWSATGSVVSVGAGSGVVTGMSAGTATIVYTLLGTGCTAVRTFTVYPLPTAITGATAVCMGSMGTLSNGIAGGTWSPALDTIMKLDAVTGDITGIKYGETIITYTTANGCSATTTVTVHVVPNIYNMMGGGSYCAGDTGVHVLVAGSIIGTKYDLYNGATLVDTKMGTNKTLDFGLVTTPGTYTAIATQTITTCQSKMDTSATVVVNPLMPTAVGIIPTPSAIVCAGTPVLYTAVPVNGGATPFYEWKVNGVSYGTGGTTYGYTPVKGDIVSLKMTSSVVCPSPLVIYGFLPMTVVDSIPPIVTITADPGVHVATGQPVTLTATVTNGITGLSYQWRVNGAAIAGATDNTYTESNPTDHEVVSCAVMSNATCMTSDEESVELSIGAEGIAYPSNPSAPKGGLSVYPSPAKGSITVESSLNNASVSIYNVVGERVWFGLTMTKNKETIDVSEFLPGVYLLQAVDGSTGLTMTKRFVKE